MHNCMYFTHMYKLATLHVRMSIYKLVSIYIFNLIQCFHEWLSTPHDIWKTIICSITTCRNNEHVKLYIYIYIYIHTYIYIYIYIYIHTHIYIYIIYIIITLIIILIILHSQLGHNSLLFSKRYS